MGKHNKKVMNTVDMENAQDVKFEAVPETPEASEGETEKVSFLGKGLGKVKNFATLISERIAASLGIPAIAVSQHIDKDEVKFDEGAVEIDFSSTQRVVKNLVKKIRDKGMPGDIKLLNLNVPSNPDSYEPVIAGLAKRMYLPGVEKRLDPRGKPYYWITGELHTDNPVDTDGYILQNKNLPTLTPLSLDMTYGLDILKDWI